MAILIVAVFPSRLSRYRAMGDGLEIAARRHRNAESGIDRYSRAEAAAARAQQSDNQALIAHLTSLSMPPRSPLPSILLLRNYR